jgi:hypothetical protein
MTDKKNFVISSHLKTHLKKNKKSILIENELNISRYEIFGRKPIKTEKDRRDRVSAFGVNWKKPEIALFKHVFIQSLNIFVVLH